MIINLEKFILEETPYWESLEKLSNQLSSGEIRSLDYKKLEEIHYLYQRAADDLAKIQDFSSDTQIKQYLEQLVANAFSNIYYGQSKKHRFRPIQLFFIRFPQVFRKHKNAFLLSFLITFVGMIFGGVALLIDQDAKSIVMPFSHLKNDPSERVQQEEIAKEDRMAGRKSSFAAYLMTHNIKVSIFTFALGISFGLGTIILLFYNGIILGAVAIDYMMAGETEFLIGWLLPHGSIEIPAILIAGQAGFVLAKAVIGWQNELVLKDRVKAISGDVMILVFGFSVMLIWAGIVESFISQYHEPRLPYLAKIIFGFIELVLLAFLLTTSGKKSERS